MQTVDDWLKLLEARHPTAIDLGLERVRAVWTALGEPRPAPVCIVVGGTNGKGSTVALLASMYRHAGYRVGTYTSPHLLRYNERISVDGVDIDDSALLRAFERVEAARGQTSITYFEFGTLAAFVHLHAAHLDVAILEIGLGGRLDAVNLIDGDVSILTSVDLDHQAYLGDTRDAIGWEKAHIFRAGKPAVTGEPDLPTTVVEHATASGARLMRIGVEFAPAIDARRWSLAVHDEALAIVDLPWPALRAPCQIRNAACAVLAARLLNPVLPVSHAALGAGLASVRLAGRMQVLDRSVETVVDVAHNPESARTLAAWLGADSARKTVAVFSALADKDLSGIVEPLKPCFDAWIALDLSGAPRGRTADALVDQLAELGIAAKAALSAGQALALADAEAGEGGRVLVFGSFLTVSAVLGAIRE
jgi:dihydrofolate synthase/folylpolyglutamate synthase